MIIPCKSPLFGKFCPVISSWRTTRRKRLICLKSNPLMEEIRNETFDSLGQTPFPASLRSSAGGGRPLLWLFHRCDLPRWAGFFRREQNGSLFGLHGFSLLPQPGFLPRYSFPGEGFAYCLHSS